MSGSLRVRVVDTSCGQDYVVEVGSAATVGDVVCAFFREYRTQYPHKYVSSVIADGRAISNPKDLRLRVSDLMSPPQIQIVPYLPEVESVLRRWFDEGRRRLRGGAVVPPTTVGTEMPAPLPSPVGGDAAARHSGARSCCASPLFA